MSGLLRGQNIQVILGEIILLEWLHSIYPPSKMVAIFLPIN
jgi:hypothetical protein